MRHAWSTVGLQSSHQQRLLALLFSGLLGLSVLSWPATSPWLLPAFLLLLPGFYSIAQWSQSSVPRFLTLSRSGELRWHADQWPAGKLVAGSVICRFGVWLRWQDQDGKQHQRWLFRDQISVENFRLLGRHCQQISWQHAD